MSSIFANVEAAMRRESHGGGSGGEARIAADAPLAASAFEAKCSDEGKGGEGKKGAVVGDGGEADLAATVSHAESLKQQGNRHYKKQEWAEAVMW